MPYRFEDYVLDRTLRELRRGTELVAVEPQVFDLLSFLIDQPDRVVSKNDLIAAIWHGRIVSESALTSRINSARAALGDSGEEQRLIKTLRGKGFRFVGAVSEAAPAMPAAPTASTGAPPRPYDRPSIAVLPFVNIRGDPTEDYFADGMTEEIITELARFKSLFVIARNSSFAYRRRATDIKQVAQDFGVRYLLEGSVRRAGDRVRVNTQLIDAMSARRLWAQRYDRDLQDLFAVQDELTRSIVAVLPDQVETAALDQATRKTSSSLHAYDHLLQGKYYHHLETAEANRQAEIHFDRAIALDPRFASAYAWKACTIGQAHAAEYRPRTPEELQQSIDLVEQAMRIDPNDAECHRIMCRIALMQGRYAKSEYHLELALMLNPNDPRLVVQRGINLTVMGEPEAAIAWIEQAMRLDPFSAYRYYLDWVRALFMAGRPLEAIAVLERNARTHWEHDLWLAACHAAAGAQTGAREIGQRVIAQRPALTIAAYVNGRFNRSEDRARLSDSLAEARLPR